MPLPRSFLNLMPLEALDNHESPLIFFSLLSLNDKAFLGKVSLSRCYGFSSLELVDILYRVVGFSACGSCIMAFIFFAIWIFLFIALKSDFYFFK